MSLLKKRLALFLYISSPRSTPTYEWERCQPGILYLYRKKAEITVPEIPKGLDFVAVQDSAEGNFKDADAPNSTSEQFFKWTKRMYYESILPSRLIYLNPEYMFALPSLQWEYRTQVNMKLAEDRDLINGLSLANRIWAQTYYSNWAKKIMANVASAVWQVLVYELYEDQPWMFYVRPAFYAINILFVWLVELCYCDTDQPKLKFIWEDVISTFFKSLLPEIIMALIGAYLPQLYYSCMIVFINIIIRFACSKLHSLIMNPNPIQWEKMYLRYEKNMFIPSVLKSFFAVIQCVDVISVVIWYIQNYFSEDWAECFDVMAWLSDIILELPKWSIVLYLTLMVIVYLYDLYQKIKIYNELRAKNIVLPPPTQVVLAL